MCTDAGFTVIKLDVQSSKNHCLKDCSTTIKKMTHNATIWQGHNVFYAP